LAVGVIVLAVFVVTATASPATHQRSAPKEPITSGFSGGRMMSNYDFGPIKLKPENKLASGIRRVANTVAMCEKFA
jgi:hypothetical protein